MARCPPWLHDAARGDEPRGTEVLRHADTLVGSPAVLPALPHAPVLLHQRLPGLQGESRLECPYAGRTHPEETTCADHPHSRVLPAFSGDDPHHAFHRQPQRGPRLLDESRLLVHPRPPLHAPHVLSLLLRREQTLCLARPFTFLIPHSSLSSSSSFPSASSRPATCHASSHGPWATKDRQTSL